MVQRCKQVLSSLDSRADLTQKYKPEVSRTARVATKRGENDRMDQVSQSIGQ